jgi:ribosomal protein L37AE/L43A
MRETFEPTRTLLSQQRYPGSSRLIKHEKVRSVVPSDGRAYTIRRVECPECGATGEVDDYHGTNCFWDCRECGAALKS